MTPLIHGTVQVPGKHHPVFDVVQWAKRFPLDKQRSEGGWINGPAELVRTEQARALAGKRGALGPSVPADLFVWADTPVREKPWLTRIGGVPWRESRKAWPRGKDGAPLVFLGQICFVDSKKTLPFDLPGEVALIFGGYSRGCVSLEYGSALEWSPLTLKDFDEYGMTVPRSGLLPFRYQGGRHRSLQYTDSSAYDEAFRSIGFKEGGFRVGSVQATSIGTYASLPQGWPFMSGDGNTLAATLSSLYVRDEWPLVDLPRAPERVLPDAQRMGWHNSKAVEFGVGDAGCMWIYRDKRGKFRLADACG